MLAFVLTAAAAMIEQPLSYSGSVGNVTNVFSAACLDGQVRLRADEAVRSSFEQLPRILQERLGRPTSAQVWRLAGAESYLYMLTYPDKPGTSPRICGVASDQSDLEDGAAMLDVRLTGDRLQHGSRTMEWLRPQDGYNAISTSAGQFHVLQINWLSEADRKLQNAQLSPFAH